MNHLFIDINHIEEYYNYTARKCFKLTIFAFRNGTHCYSEFDVTVERISEENSHIESNALNAT